MLLRAATGASRVVVFDATRRSDGGGGARNRDGLRSPASRVHVDYTLKSGPQRVRDFFGQAEAERLAQAGAGILQANVWRPIRGPVERSPLALADAASVRPEDLVASDQIFGEAQGLLAHPRTARKAGAEPDHQASRRDLLERRDGRGLCHRMAIARDQHGGAKFDALRLFGDAGESDPYVVAEGGNLGTPDRAKA